MSQLRRKPNLSDESLPHDVVFDILTRLPVKSLIRFRIVSYEGLGDEKAPPPDAEVYTLSTDSWRTVELSVESVPNIGSIFAVLPNSCVFLNGALHFVAYTWGNDSDNFILSFDVNDEIFREIRLPENYLDEFYSKFDDCVHQLVVFKGMLALVVLGPAENVDEDEDEINTDICLIWVMREYGIVESWTKTNVLFDWVMTFFDCTNSGEFLIETFDSRLVSIDSESLQVNNLRIQTTTWLAYTADLMENLVLLDQQNEADTPLSPERNHGE
ncbi:F-box/kelch-repeat protein At3g06240-like isoform X2 [Quercus lobata]|uniref:F-box/kelch-repeat protein At3g06240-like isoform X2 n=1 Tax=Quercus lobata TaxID=97700 RepID=UPI0012450AF4|nr:F-box/kelch-repeat protein At3g06240-like isoform X2 [Quercus lobata]